MSNKKERRSYFRIDDEIGLNYEVIDDDAVDQPDPETEVELAFRAELDAIDVELNRAANTVWQENPAIAQALGILNKKLSLIAQHCPPQGLDRFNHVEEYAANISGSGMSFRSTEKLEKDAKLRIKAVLKPSNISIRFVASVVDCERVQEMPREVFLLRVKIADHETAAREQLVQHVVQKQSLNRAAEKVGESG